jgi:hypothetical protein
VRARRRSTKIATPAINPKRRRARKQSFPFSHAPKPERPRNGPREHLFPLTRVNKLGSGQLGPCAGVGRKEVLRGPQVAYDDLSPSSRELRSTAMRATKYSVPPSSSLVMTVLVLRTSPSRKPCTLHSSRSLPEHKAYTPAPATSKPFSSTRLGE